MNKLTTLGITALTVGAMLTPVTVNAASSPSMTVVHTGNGYTIGIGTLIGNRFPDCDISWIPDIIFPGAGNPDCNIPGVPDTEAPEENLPDSNLPDGNPPAPEAPDTEIPDDNLPDSPPDTETPDDNLPENEQPDNNLPDNLPDNSLPDNGGGDSETPEDGAPEDTLPDIDRPDSNLPDNLPDNSLPDNGGSDTETPDGPQNTYMTQVVSLVNIERAKHGLSPLSIDGSMEAAALIRAREIQNNFSHTRPNGSGFSTALKEAGVSYRASGENIAWGQTTPAEVVKVWMNSSGHRANILNSNFSRIGVGYLTSSSGTPYWVQLFAD